MIVDIFNIKKDDILVVYEPSENIIYNELLMRGYNVDVGVVEISEKNKNKNYVLKQLEINFVVNSFNERFLYLICLFFCR